MNNTTQRCTVHTQALFFPVRTPFNFARGVDRVTGNLGHFKLLARLHLYSFVRCHAVHECVCGNIKHCNLCMAFNLLWLFYIFGWLAKFFLCSLKLLKLACDVFKTHYGLVFYVVCCELLLFYGVAQGHYLRWTFHRTDTHSHSHNHCKMYYYVRSPFDFIEWNVNRQVCVFA